jgi:hypothetical protein
VSGTKRLVRWVLAIGLIAPIACSSGDRPTGNDPDDTAALSDDAVTAPDDGAGSISPAVSAPAPPPPDEVFETGDYEWRRMPLGAGGFVTGLAATTRSVDAAMYARTDVGGAYRWDPGTRTWEQLLRSSRLADGSLTPDDYYVLSVAVAPTDPDRVYLAVGNDFPPDPSGEPAGRAGRILRSDDGGQTWQASSQRWFVSGNDRYRTTGERLAVDPADSDRVVFGTQRDGLWVSSDGGAGWSQVPTDAVPTGVDDQPAGEQAGISFVAFTKNGANDDAASADLIAGVANVAILRSGDGAATWEPVVDLEQGQVPTSASVHGEALLFGVSNVAGGTTRLIRWSPTAGAVEIDLPAQIATVNVAIDPADPQSIVVAGDAIRSGELWTTTDGGESWTTHDVSIEAPEIPWLEETDLIEYMSVGRLMFDADGSGRLWFGEGMGVWVAEGLDESTVRFRSSARGIEELVVADLLSPPGGSPIVATADRQGFVLDRDRFPARTLIDERFASGAALDYSPADPDRLAWVGAESHLAFSPNRSPRGAVSDDGGSTWTEMGGLVPEMFGGEVAVSATDPDVMVWLPTRYADPNPNPDDPLGAYRSSDGGRSWERAPIDGDDNFHRLFWWLTRRALAADRVDGAFYLMSDDQDFYVSRDGAQTWQAASHAPPCDPATACHVFGQLTAVPGRAGEVWATTGTTGLHYTADAGATPWTSFPDIVNAQAMSVGPPLDGSDEPTVYVVGTHSDGRTGVLRSSDGAATWSLVATHPADLAAQITVIEADADVAGRIYVGFAGLGVVVGDPIGTGS